MGGVGFDFFNRVGEVLLLDPRGCLPWQVERSDLEAVKEEAGAAGVDLVGGDAAEDLSDGKLDGGAIFRERQMEGGFAALGGDGSGFTGGVVVIAK